MHACMRPVLVTFFVRRNTGAAWIQSFTVRKNVMLSAFGSDLSACSAKRHAGPSVQPLSCPLMAALVDAKELLKPPPRPVWSKVKLPEMKVRIAFLPVPHGDDCGSLWTFRDVTEVVEPGVWNCKIWNSGVTVWADACKLMGTRVAALQAPHQKLSEGWGVTEPEGSGEGSNHGYRAFLPDLVASPGYVLCYLLHRATQTVARRFKIDTKTRAQVVCASTISEALTNCELRPSPLVSISVDMHGCADVRPLVVEYLHDDCRRRGFDVSRKTAEALGWLESKWQQMLTEAPTSSWVQGASFSYCSIGAAFVFLVEQVGFDIVFSAQANAGHINVLVSGIETIVQALEYMAAQSDTSAVLDNPEDHKTATGRLQSGARMSQDSLFSMFSQNE